MNGAANAARYEIYPRRYFDESQTWYAWNKLTIADVFNLREEPGFQGQNVFFYNNHPIQFVRIVGIIVDIELVRNTNICLITIDDSSGSNITAKIRRDQQVTNFNERVYLPSTSTEGLKIDVGLGEPVLHLGSVRLEIGTIVRAQGTVSAYREERQIDLKRLFLVRDTNEESGRWQDVADWKQTVLDQPWILTQEQRDRADLKERNEEARRRKKAQSEKKHRTKHDAKRAAKQEERENRRKSKETKLNAGALKGSDVLPSPWDD